MTDELKTEKKINTFWAAVFMFVGLCGVAVAAALCSVQVNYGPSAIRGMETKQMGDLMEALEAAAHDPKKSKAFHPPPNKLIRETRGRQFWQVCFVRGALEPEYLRKIVSLADKDGTPIDPDVFEREGELAPQNCSYTGPSFWGFDTGLKSLRERVVLFCFDSRNWNNYPEKGVLCAWLDGVVDFIDAARAEREFGIKKEVFAQPELVIGKLPPFHRTFEMK
ncbi:MAG: hypothetical protein IT462_16115 [Planctomycetes bacterium]|nr:hypothetical protein [Planctomycetota bacterium]